MKNDFVITSESVTAGHPDKLCDQISDAIVDHFLALDPGARIICECAVAKAIAFIAARFASTTEVDIPHVVRQTIQQTGYTEGQFSARDCSILTSLIELPATARVSHDEGELDDADLETLVARNQVTAFGFACDQTPTLMPMPIWLAHRLARRLSVVRTSLPYLTPDGTVQIAVEYRNRQPNRVHAITLAVSQQTPDSPTPDVLRANLIETVIQPVFQEETVHPDKHTHIYVNPNGVRVGGGPALHSGMTGRKTAVDTYGGYSRHSESALSGKDPLRVDRISAYMARFAAKNLVAAGLAAECEVQLSYSIGLARPVSVQVETFGTGKLEDDELARRIKATMDFRVGGIIRAFKLRHLPSRFTDGFYRKLAVYGQVGRTDIDLPWEKTDSAQSLCQ
jgi:S-adenosylmethionine synthetase